MFLSEQVAALRRKNAKPSTGIPAEIRRGMFDGAQVKKVAPGGKTEQGHKKGRRFISKRQPNKPQKTK